MMNNLKIMNLFCLFTLAIFAPIESVPIEIEDGCDTMSKSEMEAALIKAAEFDKYNLVNCLLKNGANVSAENEKGIPAIIYAAGFGNSEILELLIENGADVNATNYENQTVLQFMIASVFSSIHPNVTELVRKVINKGAYVNAVDSTGDTSLIWAARSGHLDIVKMLLEFEATIDATNYQGYTPLLWAAENKHLDSAQYLVEKGANVHAIITGGDYAGYTAYTFAAQRGDEAFAEFLTQNGVNLTSGKVFGYCSTPSDEKDQKRPENLICPSDREIMDNGRRLRSEEY